MNFRFLQRLFDRIDSGCIIHRRAAASRVVAGLCLGMLLTCFAGGCASSRTLVILIPDSADHTGHTTVSNAAGSVELKLPNESVSVPDVQSPPGRPVILDEETIRKTFGEVLQAEPLPPAHFILYFSEDANLTTESIKMMDDVLIAIRNRRSEDISVIGHTDTVGNKAYNYDLSKRRAAAVSALLRDRGVEPAIIRTTSHGQENPLIPTGDNVTEPRNRRVEIVVR